MGSPSPGLHKATEKVSLRDVEVLVTLDDGVRELAKKYRHWVKGLKSMLVVIV